MSAITMIITETEAPGPLSYTLAPTDINYSVDRCRGRLFRDEDYDSRWSPPVGRESQCPGRVDEDSLCSRCLHNKARWRESCGTADLRGGNQDWWGRVDDPLPARAPTLAGKGWAAEKKPVWAPAPAPAAPAETVESLTATLATLTAEYVQIRYCDYEFLVEDENEWPRESEGEGLYADLQKEQTELSRLNKVIKKGGVLPPAPAPAAAAPPAAAPETEESLRVKVADMRKKRDYWKQALDDMLAEGWVISKAVRKAFADVREKTAVAREFLALRAENVALKATAAAAVVPADMTAENAALRARIAALEEELADADSLSKSLTEQLSGEVQRVDEADFHRRVFESENARLCEELANLEAQLAEVQTQLAEAQTKVTETSREVLEERAAAYRSHVAELTRQLGNVEENYELSKECNARLQRRCDDQAETIATMGQTIDGLRQGLEETAAAKLRFSDDYAATLERAAAAEADAAKYRELFNHLNDRVWGYGGTIASLRRRIETSEPLRRIAELEEQVAALTAQNAEVTYSFHSEVGKSIMWENRMYAAEARTANASPGEAEVHELRAQLVAQKELILARDQACAAVAALKTAAAEDRANMVHWMARGEAAEKVLKEQHDEMTREIERLRAEVAALEERVAVADYEADEAHEESADFQRALAHEGDREEERDRWQERYKDLRRLIAETLAEVEPILERERTMPAGVALRALSLLK